MARDKRFEKVHAETGFATSNEIWMDTVTGVNYLYHQSGYSGGLTPLLDEKGNVVVTPQQDIGRDNR